MMNPIRKIREWFLLRNARKEESKKMPSQDQIDNDQKKFLDEATELRTMITKRKPKRKLYKSRRKTSKKK